MVERDGFSDESFEQSGARIRFDQEFLLCLSRNKSVIYNWKKALWGVLLTLETGCTVEDLSAKFAPLLLGVDDEPTWKDHLICEARVTYIFSDMYKRGELAEPEEVRVDNRKTYIWRLSEKGKETANRLAQGALDSDEN